MADKTIAELTAVVTPAGADVLPIVSGGATKKVTVDDLVAASARGVKVGTGASTPTLDKVLIGTGTGTSAWGDPPDSAAVAALEDKVGTGASTPVFGQALVGTDTGESAWRRGDTFHVSMWGAVPDGTLQTTNLQAAIDGTPVGCTLVFGSTLDAIQTYVSRKLTAKSGITYAGAGGLPDQDRPTVQLQLADGTDDDLFWVPVSVNTIKFRGLDLDGNKTNQSGTSNGIHFEEGNGSSNARIVGIAVEDCHVHDFLTDGIYGGKSFVGLTIMGGMVSKNGRDGIRMGADTTHIDHTLIGENGRYGVLCEGPAYNISNCDSYRNLIGVMVGNQTSYTLGPWGGSIIGGSIDANRQEGLVLNTNARYCTVVGTRIHANSGSNQYTANRGLYANVKVLDTSGTASFTGVQFYDDHNAGTGLYSAKYDYQLSGPVNEAGCTHAGHFTTALADDMTHVLTRAAPGLYVDLSTDDASGPQIQGRKTRDPQGGQVIVQDGDSLFDILGLGSDGALMKSAAMIRFSVDGAPGANDMPGRITFYTAPDGSTTLAERLRITEAGRLILGGSAGPQIVKGTGSPEGAVTATRGSMYVQTDGDSGRVVWFHDGAGDTGWESYTGHGTYFPATPYTGQRFYRSDRNIEYFYDGTRWLSTQLFMVYANLNAVGATNVNLRLPITDPNGADKWLERITFEYFVASGGTALDGSNKWVVATTKEEHNTAPAAGTALASWTINSGDSNLIRTGTTATINALAGTTFVIFQSSATKTGAPGALNGWPVIEYRIVG